jgi:hypothetical protein
MDAVAGGEIPQAASLFSKRRSAMLVDCYFHSGDATRGSSSMATC